MGLSEGQNHEKEAWDEKVRMWAAAKDDCLWINKVQVGWTSRVAGVVSRLRLDPEKRILKATITDGTGTLSAQWEVQNPPIDQMRAAPGYGLILEGMAEIGPEGQLLMMEPEFEIVAGPEHE